LQKNRDAQLLFLLLGEKVRMRAGVKTNFSDFPPFVKFAPWPTSNAPAGFAKKKHGQRNLYGAGYAPGVSTGYKFRRQHPIGIYYLDFFARRRN